MVAWASVIGESLDCSKCKRPKTFLCPKRDHIGNEELLQMIADSPLPKSVPLALKAEQVNICPVFFLTPFARLVTKAYNWWESGQLGMTLMDAPYWIDEAFSILSSERSKARSFRVKNRDR